MTLWMRAVSSVLAVSAVALLPAHASDDRQPRGAAIFKARCVQCHGEKGDGQGPLAKRFNPPPANLARSQRTDDYKMQIIALGGAAMGRSPVMPEWGLELSEQEIVSVVAFLRQLADESRARPAEAGSQRAVGR